VGAGIARQRIDHDGGHCGLGEAYLKCAAHHHLNVTLAEVFCRPDPARMGAPLVASSNMGQSSASIPRRGGGGH